MNLKKLTAFASATAMSLAMLHSYPAQTFEIDWNFAANAADGVAINATNFPDEIFRSYVSDYFDTNSDGALSTAEIADVTEIYLDDDISNTKGIEFFTHLEILWSYSSKITEIDLRNNIMLKDLCFMSFNRNLPALDVSNNTMLERLYCGHLALTEIDVSKNVNLVEFICLGNYIEELDVSNNIALESLKCGDNKLASLDVSKNVNLVSLECSGNNITALDVSKNTSLVSLECSNNEITALDVSGLPKLHTLYCYNNQLTELDLSKNNMLSNLNCSNNQLAELDLRNNTELYELYCSDNCITTLDLSNIIDLGILDCADNMLTTLDVSKHTQLWWLYCDGNQLTSLDVSNNPFICERWYFGNTYHIGAVGEEYYLSLLPGNFDVTKASNWQGAICENGVLTNFVGIDGENKVTYDYDAGNGETVEFTLTYTLAEEVSGIIGTGLSADISLEDITYISDDNSPVISFTASVDYRGNEYFLDISDYIMVSADTDIDPTLDMTATGTGDESVSAFDLYWSAYNAGTPTTEFTCEYIFDMSRVDELFCELTAISGLSMNYEDNADYFEYILYEDGEAILIGDEPYTCKIAQRGDANLDHAVDTRDAASMAKYCSLVANGAENPELSATDNELAQFSGDVNCDGVIDTKDAAIAAKYASLYAVYESDNIASIYYNIYAEMGIIE